MSEEWRIIAEFPDYAVSNLGRVKRIVVRRNGRAGTILRSHDARYASITLYSGGEPNVVSVHRIVCKAFHGAAPSPNHEVAHNDGDGLNNRSDNLRWATREENEADKLIHGTALVGRACWVPTERRARGIAHGRHTKPECTARGERGRAKLTAVIITNIRRDVRPRKEIAKSYGISVTMVGYIQRGIAWAHVPMPSNSENNHE